MQTLGSIVVPLVAAAVIGFVVGWFFSRSGGGTAGQGSDTGDGAAHERTADGGELGGLSDAEAATFERRVAQLEADYAQRSEAFAAREAELTAAGRKVVEQLRLRERELEDLRAGGPSPQAPTSDETADSAPADPTSSGDEHPAARAGADVPTSDHPALGHTGGGSPTAESPTIDLGSAPEQSVVPEEPAPVTASSGRARRRAVIDPATGLPIGAGEPQEHRSPETDPPATPEALDDPAPPAGRQRGGSPEVGPSTGGSDHADPDDGIQPDRPADRGPTASGGDGDGDGETTIDLRNPVAAHEEGTAPDAGPDNGTGLANGATVDAAPGARLSVRMVAPRSATDDVQVIDLRQRREDREAMRQQPREGVGAMALAGGSRLGERARLAEHGGGASAHGNPARGSSDVSDGLTDAGRVGTESANGRRDDLTRIVGIGPKLAGELREAGVSTFADLAHLDPDGSLPEAIESLRGRMRRDDWVGQARALIG